MDEGPNIHNSRSGINQLQATNCHLWRVVGGQANFPTPLQESEWRELLTSTNNSFWHGDSWRLNIPGNTEKTLFTCSDCHAKRSSSERPNECRKNDIISGCAVQIEQRKHCKLCEWIISFRMLWSRFWNKWALIPIQMWFSLQIRRRNLWVALVEVC